MSWRDRIREAAYNSPSGKRLIFDYENVNKTIDKKTTGFEFPDANGTYVQDLGHSGYRYFLRLFFWGDDHDLEAEEFEEMLLEIGTGKLEHPMYGAVDVVPFGTITRRDDLKTASNQTILEVTFWATIGIIYPSSQLDPGSEVLESISGYNDVQASEFEDGTDLESIADQAYAKNSFQTLLDSARQGMQAVADTQRDVQNQFDSVSDSINQSIDILIGQPLTLASQTMIMLQSPARSLTNIQARLDAYKNLLSTIISGDDSVLPEVNGSRNKNLFRINDLYASTYITGFIISAINNQFITKADAIESAEFILNQFDDVSAWRDDNYKSLKEIDIGSAYQQLQKAVALTVGFLIDISFNLKQERKIILTSNRTVIDLVAELYGSVDDQLDFFINSNDLSGSEILELPKGREIVYYL